MNKSFQQSTFLFLMIAAVHTALAQGTAYDDPADIGEQVNSVIQVGPMNTSNYDVVINLLEIRRGGEAMRMIKAANRENKPPTTGFEYLLARIRFELKGRAVSDQGSFVLGSSPFQWLANSADFRQYDSPSAVPPEPALQGPIRAGETREGWLVFEVEKKEDKPILTFDPASGGATGRGNILFFKLY